jgi:hypothetical protein
MRSVMIQCFLEAKGKRQKVKGFFHGPDMYRQAEHAFFSWRKYVAKG